MRFFSLLAVCAVWAFSAERFRLYTTENGLPSNSVQAIRQTHDGYIWFTTQRGILRFDGVTFNVYDPFNTPVIHGTNFTSFCLFEDSKGRLWACGWNLGAIYYEDGRFKALTTNDGLPSNAVLRIDEDEQGGIWIFTDAGLARLRSGGKLEQVKLIDGEPVQRYLTPPSNLGIDPYLCGLWRIREGKLERFAYGAWRVIPLPKGVEPDTAKFDALIEDSKRRLWFNILSRPGESFRVANEELTVVKGLPLGSFVNYEDRFGRLWISDPAGHTGLWSNGATTPIGEIKTGGVFRVIEDASGGFWAGTRTGGLAHGVSTVFETVWLPGGANVNEIGPIVQSRVGDLWVGSYGVTEIHANRLIRFPLPGNLPREQQHVGAMWAENDGTILIGYPGEIKMIKNGVYRNAENPLNEIHSDANAILRDHAGTLWVGTGDGLFRYRGGTLTEYDSSNSALRGDVRALFDDQGIRLWVGTDDGLCEYAYGREELSCHFPQDRLSHWPVRSIYSDVNHVIWVGTATSGLLRIEGNKFFWIRRSEGLFTNDVGVVLEDKNGYFWISSPIGVYRVKRQELDSLAHGQVSEVSCTHFGNVDGLNHMNTVGNGQPHGLVARDGKLWFPTSAGLAVVDPDHLQFDNSAPSVRIEGCSIEQVAVGCEESVTVPAGHSGLEIKYGALILVRGEQARFRYMLEGLDTKWTDAGNRNTAYFSHLPPGDYRFLVTGAASEGVWNAIPKALPIRVLPHFYESTNFRLLLFGAALLTLLLAWRRRTLDFQRKQAARQAYTQQVIASQETERKRIAAELHDSLGQRLSLISALAEVLERSTNGNFGDRIQTILGEARQAASEVRKISHDLRPYQLDLLGLAKAMELLTKRTCEAASIKFAFTGDDLNGALPAEMEIHFYRVLQECLNNIVKHAKATFVSVIVKRNAGSLSMSVTDDGVGFDSNNKRIDGQLGGFGMKSIVERCEFLGGTADIDSSPGRGTTVSVKVACEVSNG